MCDISKIMGSNLMTTFCSSSSSSSSSGSFEMEMLSNSNGCFSFNRDQSSRSSQIAASSMCVTNGTSSKKITDRSLSSTSSLGLVPFCGIILSLVLLNLVIILQDFYSSFHCTVSIFKFFLRTLSCNWLIASTATPSSAAKTSNIQKCCSNGTNNHDHKNQITETKDDDDDDHLSLLELKKVMILEGSSSKSDNRIAGVFEEEEPSLKEVKDAFDIFDENKDGFIDANELRNVLLCLGFFQETAPEEDCKRMIKAFDDNSDGKIDFNEFVKVMETSLC